MFFTEDVGVLISSFPFSLYEREENLDTYPPDTVIKLLTILLMCAKTCKLSHPQLRSSSLAIAKSSSIIHGEVWVVLRPK